MPLAPLTLLAAAQVASMLARISVFLMIFALAGYVIYAIFRFYQLWSARSERDILEQLDDEARELQALAATKARLLRDIKDLEFDFQTGHLSDDDYKTLRGKLERQAIATLKRLDERRGEVDYDDVIDREYAARFGKRSEQGAKPAASLRAEALAAPKAVPAPKTAAPDPKPAAARGVACGSCGHSNAPGARCCSECGGALSKPRFCHECGASLQENAKFCAECGTPARHAVATRSAQAVGQESQA
jgi:hypothetical protein